MDVPWPLGVSPTDYLLSLVLNPGRRISVLLVVAYVTGVGGLLFSVLGNPANPRSIYGVGGIVLMGVCFLCLFVLSVTMVNLAPERGDE